MTRRAWVAFAIVAVLWGIPYLLIKVAVAEVSPVFLAWIRFLLAAALLLPVAAARGAVRPALVRWRWILLLAFFYMALAWTLIPFAERSLTSSLTAIIIAGVPLAVAMIQWRSERPSGLRAAGLLAGFTGVAALVGLDVGSQPGRLVGVAALLVVLMLYAAGPVLTARKLAGIQPVATSALSCAMAAGILTVPVLFQLPARLPSAPVLGSLLVLGVLCSAVAMVAFFQLILEAGPGRAAVVTYVNPAVAVVAGALLLHERVTPSALLGMALILAGSWLATTGRLPFRRAAVSGGGAVAAGAGPSAGAGNRPSTR